MRLETLLQVRLIYLTILTNQTDWLLLTLYRVYFQQRFFLLLSTFSEPLSLVQLK